MKRSASYAALLAALFSLPLSAQGKDTYLWVHPKLGLQKIERATNAPVRATRSPAPTTGVTRIWIDPKGNIKRIAQVPSAGSVELTQAR